MGKDIDDAQQKCLTPPKNAAIIDALFDVEAKEKKIAHQVILLQMAVALICAGVAYSMEGTPQFAIAVLSGGGISVINGALLAWRMVSAALHPAHEAHHQLRLMYFYAAERFLVVIMLLCLCMIVVKFSPLALLGGFVIAQAALLVGRLFLGGFKTGIATKNV